MIVQVGGKVQFQGEALVVRRDRDQVKRPRLSWDEVRQESVGVAVLEKGRKLAGPQRVEIPPSTRGHSWR